jgi:hypothetical protein
MKRAIALTIYLSANVGLMLSLWPANVDWELWNALPDAIETGTIYRTSTEQPFIWSPVAAPIMAAVSAIGWWPWTLAHIGAVFLLRDRWLIGLTLTSWPFWVDTVNGNVFVFIFVAGVLALRGSRAAGLAYLILLLFMPRPVQVPLAGVILWKDRSLWLPFALVFVAHALAVVGSGYAVEWLTAMRVKEATWNLSPAQFLGWWWLVIGVPLAGWLMWIGRPGLAGLAMSPYVLPPYWLMALVPRVEVGHQALSANVPRRRPTSPRTTQPTDQV